MKTLLIIDPDTRYRLFIEHLATSMGIGKVLGAQCLYDGMVLLQEHPVDLIIMEVFLPERCGLAFISQITSQANSPPIIATFSLANSRYVNLEKLTESLGVVYTFQKPVGQEMLFCALEDVLQLSQKNKNHFFPTSPGRASSFTE